MDFLQSACKLVANVCSGFFYLFVDLNLPALRKAKKETEVSSCELNRSLFECPGCQGIPLPPVWTCSSGHIVCSKCKETGKCVVCGGNYNGNARNFIVEQIVTTNKFPCRFYPDGCDKILNAEDLSGHETHCFHRHCKCGIVGKGCDGTWAGSINGFYAHLVISHEMFYVFPEKKATLQAEFDPATTKFIRFTGPTVMLKVVQGKNYMIRTLFREELNLSFTYIIGLYRDDINYKTPEQERIYKRATASIKFLLKDAVGAAQKDPTTSERVWIGPVNTVDDKPADLLEEEKGLLLPWSELLDESEVNKKILKWNLQIIVFPHEEVQSDDATSTMSGGLMGTGTLKDFLGPFVRPFFVSTWSIVAPTFTLLVILTFMFIV